ncbi:MAG: hypothetical protein WBP45_15750 [Daejeonella sp.]
MFALQYGSGFLDLMPGENPVIEWVSTAFNNSEDLLGSFSYPVELANTPNNDRLLNFARHLSARSSRKQIEVIPHLFGTPWKKCDFEFELKSGRISGNLKIDNGAFATIIKEKELPAMFAASGDRPDFVIQMGNNLSSLSLALINSRTPGAAPYTFYPHFNDGAFGGDLTTGKKRIINNWYHIAVNPTFWIISNADNDINWFNASLYLTWVLEQVCNYLGYQATGDFMEDEFIRSLVIDNTGLINPKEFYNPNGYQLKPHKHLPKMKLTDLFKQLREEFKLVYYFDSDTKKAHFVFSDTVITSGEAIDLKNYVQTKKIDTKRLSETGYELVQGFDDADEFFKIKPYVKSFFIGNETIPKKIELPIGTAFMRSEPNVNFSGNPIWRLPIKRQVANAYHILADGTDAYNVDYYSKNEFKLRLLSYRGMMEDSLGNEYPYATSDGLAPDGVTVICPSLWLGGENGILNRYHRNWYGFYLQTEETKLKLNLPHSILSKLSPLKKVRFETEQGTAIEAMMSKLSFQAEEQTRLLKADFVVFPFYNQTAIGPISSSDFEEGEVINEDIWAKLVLENVNHQNKPWPNSTTKKSEHGDVVLYFYYDQAGTLPRVVSNLAVKVIQKYLGLHPPPKYTPLTATVSGSRAVFPNLEQTELYYNYGSKYRTWKYTLSDNGGGYKLI